MKHVIFCSKHILNCVLKPAKNKIPSTIKSLLMALETSMVGRALQQENLASPEQVLSYQRCGQARTWEYTYGISPED